MLVGATLAFAPLIPAVAATVTLSEGFIGVGLWSVGSSVVVFNENLGEGK